MSNPLEEGGLEDLFGSFSTLVGKDNAVLVPKDSSETLLSKLINDHIYGLLSQEELTSQQIALLTALLQGRR